MSDNGPQLIPDAFAKFMSLYRIKHSLVPPYHPASNGASERSVRLLKEALEKQALPRTREMSVKHRLTNLLIKYRSTPPQYDQANSN